MAVGLFLKKWYWQTGSGSSWANMEFGDCTAWLDK